MLLGQLTRNLFAPALVAGLVVSGLVATPADAVRGPGLQRRIDLPDDFRPEGITIGRAHRAFLGSRKDGDIYAANLRTGAGRVISQGDGSMAVGLKLDRRKRLWVAGGDDGDAKVVSTRNGVVLARYKFTSRDSFVNDVVLRKGVAWFTDSRRAVLYKVTYRGGPAARAKVRTLALRGAWRQVPDTNNANGISTTPNGRALLVVQSSTGKLFRVNPRTGNAVQVRLGSEMLTNGDGLLRRGRIMYVVKNQLNRVAVLRLAKSGRRGHLVRTLTSPDFDVPTTVARYRRSLYLPNARFTTPESPTTDYWITRIKR
ncbi:MAG: SMP-30/Gluconolaconase/LRE domain protein [Marmoricola sp.]|nr:SMP-30/Gluconolaconase/LRE domain protein [Marmoricola sp.]